MTALDLDFLERLQRLSNGEPVSRKLALLVRPTFIAPKGKVYCWSDWSQIEARMLPWLSGSRGGDTKLDLFRQNDKDPSRPDVYMVAAGDMMGKPPAEVTKLERQSHGKVTELSLGYGGGVGALLRMAANYRVYIPQETAKWMVGRWRENNQWAVHFWGKHSSRESFGLWGAACAAVENPGDVFGAGRVAFMFDKNYLKGTLIMALPSGVTLMYPRIKWAMVDVKDKKTGEVLYQRYTLVFRKGYGYSSLWHGRLAENATQAECATILRRTLVRLEYDNVPLGPTRYSDWMPVVGHTHDEVVTEVEERHADEAKTCLRNVMLQGFDWLPDFPLQSEETINWYYTKAKVDHA